MEEFLGAVCFYREDSDRFSVVTLDGESYLAYRSRIAVPSSTRSNTLIWFRIEFGDSGKYKVTSVRLVGVEEYIDPHDLQTLDDKLQDKKNFHKNKMTEEQKHTTSTDVDWLEANETHPK